MPSYTIYVNVDDHTASAFGLSTGGNPVTVGNTGWRHQYFGRFDTSAVVGTLSTNALVLNITTIVDSPTIRVRDRGWTSVVSGNYTTSASSYNLLGTSGVLSGTGSLSVSLNALVVSASWALMVTEVEAETASSSKQALFNSAEESGTTNDPYLSITTVVAVPRSFGVIIA